MEHIAALLLIVGCSGDLQNCREIPAPMPIFESMEDCDGEIGPTRRAMDGVEPRVFAKCVFVDPAMPEEDAQLHWDVTKAGLLEAEITFGGAAVASVQ